MNNAQAFLSKANSTPMYLLALGVVAFVILMSVVFMIKAYREGVRIGMDKKQLNKAISGSALFTILPSVGILLGVIALAGTLGIPLPWIRLSVVGALHYETTMAEIAAEGMGLSLDASVMTGQAFATIALIMTIGIIWGIVFLLIGYKKYQTKLLGSGKKGKGDGRLGDLIFAAMFIGMIAAFLASYISKAREGSFIAIIAMAAAAIFMAICMFCMNKLKWKWLENFALPISMFVGMATAVFAGMGGIA